MLGLVFILLIIFTVCPSTQTGPGCAECIIGYYGNPYIFNADGINVGMCLACECDILGSDFVGCDLNGTCTCKENAIGKKCDICKTGYFPLPKCNEGNWTNGFYIIMAKKL